MVMILVSNMVRSSAGSFACLFQHLSLEKSVSCGVYLGLHYGSDFMSNYVFPLTGHFLIASKLVHLIFVRQVLSRKVHRTYLKSLQTFSVMIAVLWVVAMSDHHDDVGSISKLLLDHMMQQTRRQPS